MRVQCTCRRCGGTFEDIPANAPKRVYCSRSCKEAATKRTPLATRFWRFVNKTDSCWLWTGHLLPSKHGQIGSGGNNSKALLAHRVSWEINVGPIPAGLYVCHNCPGGDNPSCVNPAHLFLGTQLDNMRDAAAKGRTTRGRIQNPLVTLRGEAHGNARLTEADVRAIRAARHNGSATRDELADRYHVHQSYIGQIERRRTWRHVT